ncbi:MAG TPA: HRDC domain-containing protein [Verrucomicrobiota bacterium]|nr:HRDC domain-containing protein [Verrucomicrobiota bacterium]
MLDGGQSGAGAWSGAPVENGFDFEAAFRLSWRGVINTEEKLAGLLPVIRAADWLALDTEADSLHAYPEKICLIQITTSIGDRLIDPLAVGDIGPLLQALAGHQLIMHAADYDMRLLFKHHAFKPDGIFDTMLAARLLGYREFGLGALAEQILGIKLDKGPQKADWARRPLTERMITYALNDTHHLKLLADHLIRALTERHRLDWHREWCARLIAECTRPPEEDPEREWRIKGAHALNRAGLAALRALWHWREGEALKANRPPFFILAHEKLIALAEAAAAQQPLEPVFPRHLSPRRREAIGRTVQVALRQPPETFPQILRTRTRRPSEAERRRYQDLEARRDRAAHALGLEPSIVANRTVLGELARDWDRYAPQLMNWQRALLDRG